MGWVTWGFGDGETWGRGYIETWGHGDLRQDDDVHFSLFTFHH